jgi:hypothetical protein
LEYDNTSNKIDHIQGESKDLADAFAGSVFKCLTDKISISEFHRERGTSKFSGTTADYSGYLGQLSQLAAFSQSEEQE